MKNNKKYLYLIIFVISILHAGEYDAIGTSRPGIANPTSSVPYGLYQFEMGTNLSTSLGYDTTFTIPILLRMGVFNNTEFQISYSSKYLSLGILYGGISLINRLENSIILIASLTENNNDLTEYSAFFPISYSIKNNFSIWGQIAGTVMNAEPNESIISYSLALGNSLNDNANWFLEVYQPLNQKDSPISIDYGFTYLADTNIQFDLSMGITLNNQYKETSRFIEWGFAFRLPN